MTASIDALQSPSYWTKTALLPRSMSSAILRMNESSIPMSRNREYRPDSVAPMAPPTAAPGGPSITAPAITPTDPPRTPPLRPLTSCVCLTVTRPRLW